MAFAENHDFRDFCDYLLSVPSYHYQLYAQYGSKKQLKNTINKHTKERN